MVSILNPVKNIIHLWRSRAMNHRTLIHELVSHIKRIYVNIKIKFIKHIRIVVSIVYYIISVKFITVGIILNKDIRTIKYIIVTINVCIFL